jgi:ribosomal protein S17
MADTTKTAQETGSRRKTVIGQVVSNKMNKTIVVEVSRQKAHPLYRRVVKRTKKLKRWRLIEVVKRTALVPGEIVAEQVG